MYELARHTIKIGQETAIGYHHSKNTVDNNDGIY